MFPDVPKIADFQVVGDTSNDSVLNLPPLVTRNLRAGETDPREIEDGDILYEGRNYYFKFHHEYDMGNTYIVYDSKQVPFAYFTISFDDD